MKSEELLFKNLFAKALKDWPEELIFGKITYYDGDRFSVEGLYDLAEEIEQRYFNRPEEIIMRHLHCRIYDKLHDVAKASLKVKVQDLRPESVKKAFENIIKTDLDNQENSNWEKEDLQLIKDYFAVNYPLALHNNQEKK